MKLAAVLNTQKRQISMSKIRLAAPLQYDSIVDGNGLRMVLWCQGCELNCPGCHNPQTHDINGGKEFEVSDILKDIDKYYKYHQGITLSGGHPLLQPEACSEIADYCHELGLDVWIYSGLTYENIAKISPYKRLLDKCDILVDGPFINALKGYNCPFRGSTNQRIIDLNRTRKEGEIVLWKSK